MHLRAEISRHWLTLALLLACSARLPADAAALSCTLELPCQANLATPMWLGHPDSPAGAFAALNLPVTSPQAGDALLVTLTFQEKEGGFLRISWKGAAGEQLLSGNFYDGIGMDNQRSLLIPASTIAGGGALCLQCGDTVLGVQKIHLEWLEEHPALLSPEQIGEEVVTALGKASSAIELDGQAAGNAPAVLDGRTVTVPLTAAPQRIEDGVEFSLQLEGVPQAARLTFAESGLGWKQHLVLWINQQRAGIISPAVPDLRDAGFSPGADKPYVGWRDGSVYLPISLLKVGANAVQLSAEDDDPASDDATAPAQPLAINRLSCQFDYTPDPAAAPVTSAAAIVAPAGTAAAITPLATPPTISNP